MCSVALPCLFDLACFVLPSFSSLNMYMYMYMYVEMHWNGYTCIHMYINSICTCIITYIMLLTVYTEYSQLSS